LSKWGGKRIRKGLAWGQREGENSGSSKEKTTEASGWGTLVLAKAGTT